MSLDPELMFALRTVIDPELGINVVDLGLVYDAEREGDVAKVRMTMTTPACPVGPQIVEEAQVALTSMVRGIQSAEVDLVFDPPWSPEKMTPEARRALGIES